MKKPAMRARFLGLASNRDWHPTALFLLITAVEKYLFASRLSPTNAMQFTLNLLE
jgi:hypothetical protein